MILRHLSKFLIVKTNSFNCEIHNFASVSKAYSERAIGKRIKVQVSSHSMN